MWEDPRGMTGRETKKKNQPKMQQMTSKNLDPSHSLHIRCKLYVTGGWEYLEDLTEGEISHWLSTELEWKTRKCVVSLSREWKNDGSDTSSRSGSKVTTGYRRMCKNAEVNWVSEWGKSCLGPIWRKQDTQGIIKD